MLFVAVLLAIFLGATPATASLSIGTTNGQNYVSAADTAPAPTTAGTMCVWMKPNWNSSSNAAGRTWIDYGWTSGDGAQQYALRMERWTDHNAYMGFYSHVSGEKRVVFADTSAFVSGVWQLDCLTWDSGSSTGSAFYIDNVSKGTRSGSWTISSWVAQSGDRFTLGNQSPLFTTPGAEPCDCSLAEFARWNRILTTAELTALSARKISPSWIVSGLLEYRSLRKDTACWGVSSECPTMSATGSPTFSETAHPPIIYPAAIMQRRLR